jgi:uncharacterized membrane protein YheB (UPF0754 family)
MPSDGKLKHKKSPKKSELDSALDQIGDQSVAAATKEFQDLLAQAKGDTTELIRQNAEELERRLILLKERKIDKEDFDYFVENQKRDLKVFIDSQPAQAQERAEKLTLDLLGMAATKVAPLLLTMI